MGEAAERAMTVHERAKVLAFHLCQQNLVGKAGSTWNPVPVVADQIEAAITAAVAEEREACAKLCEGKSDGEYIDIAGNIADLIRARSNP